MDVMETQYEDVQGKEKPIETVVEKYVRDPKTENVEDEKVKDAEAEKIRRADVSCDLCSFVTAAKKRNSRNFVKNRHKIKAQGEKEIL